MPWTTLELAILQTTSRVSSVFSLLGASFIIVTFCTSTSFHKPINRLAFFAAFGNILTNVATITSQRGIETGRSSALCRIQATFIQWFMPADALFVCTLLPSVDACTLLTMVVSCNGAKCVLDRVQKVHDKTPEGLGGDIHLLLLWATRNPSHHLPIHK